MSTVGKPRPWRRAPIAPRADVSAAGFHLGTSRRTGRAIVIDGEERFRGTLITGGIGAGKTEGAIKKRLREIVSDPEQPGALVLDCKDGLVEFLGQLTTEAGCPERLIVLRPGGPDRMNILPSWLPGRKLAESLFSAVQPFTDPHEAFWIQGGIRILDLTIELERSAAVAYAALAPIFYDEQSQNPSGEKMSAESGKNHMRLRELLASAVVSTTPSESGPVIDSTNAPNLSAFESHAGKKTELQPIFPREHTVKSRRPPPSPENVTVNEIRHLLGELRADLSGPVPSMSVEVQTRLKMIQKFAETFPENYPDRARHLHDATTFRLDARDWVNLDDRPKTSIEAEIARILYSFRPWDVASVFCPKPGEETFDGVRSIAEEGKIVVVDFPPQRDGLIGRLVNIMIKRQFFAYLVSTRCGHLARTARPVFFVADEFQNFATFGESEEADQNFVAVARAIRCSVIVATQSVCALEAVAGFHGRAALSNFLRNMRTHIYFRQNKSVVLESALAERGVGSLTASCVTALEPFQALIVRDGIAADVVEMTPDFAKGRIGASHKGDDSTLKQNRNRLDSVRRAVADRLNLPTLAEGDWKQLILANASDVARAALDTLECACHAEGVPVARLDGSSISRIDPALYLAKIAGYHPEAVASGVIILDRIDTVPLSDSSAESLRRILEDGRLDTGAPGFRFDLSRCWVVGSAVASRPRCGRYGFAAHGDTSAVKIPRWCADRMQVVWLPSRAKSSQQELDR